MAANGLWTSKVTIDTRIAEMEKKRDELTNKIARMKQCKVAFDNLPFKGGEAAFHKEYGNILIKSVEFGPPETDFHDMTYNVLTINNGTKKVPVADVLPISEATKIMYGKTT